MIKFSLSLIYYRFLFKLKLNIFIKVRKKEASAQLPTQAAFAIEKVSRKFDAKI